MGAGDGEEWSFGGDQGGMLSSLLFICHYVIQTKVERREEALLTGFLIYLETPKITALNEKSQIIPNYSQLSRKKGYLARVEGDSRWNDCGKGKRGTSGAAERT